MQDILHTHHYLLMIKYYVANRFSSSRDSTIEAKLNNNETGYFHDVTNVFVVGDLTSMI